MPDVFISHASEDQEAASFIHNQLQSEGITSFLASVSVPIGERWSLSVISQLKSSKWVIFLASKNACASAYVQQEIGMAISNNKNIVPILWDIRANELPGWAGGFQAIDLKAKTMPETKIIFSSIAERIKADRLKGLLVLGAIVAAFLKYA